MSILSAVTDEGARERPVDPLLRVRAHDIDVDGRKHHQTGHRIVEVADSGHPAISEWHIWMTFEVLNLHVETGCHLGGHGISGRLRTPCGSAGSALATGSKDMLDNVTPTAINIPARVAVSRFIPRKGTEHATCENGRGCRHYPAREDLCARRVRGLSTLGSVYLS
jgi:hypothetical protein